MRTLVLFLSAALTVSHAKAVVMKLDDGTKVAVEISKGSSQSKGSSPDVFVLVNGLIYATDRWDEVAQGLNAKGATVVRFALPGQPENLRLLKKGEEPRYFSTGLELADMAATLKQILLKSNITTQVHVVGLSYGASVAAEFAKNYPELTKDITFVAPLVVPTEEYDDGGHDLKQWLNSVRFWENSPCTLYGAFNPWLCTTQDYWYDTFYKSIYEDYLDNKIKNIPVGVNEATFKKAVFHLVRAVRDFDLKEEIKTLHNVSMYVAELDEKALAKDQKLAWKNVLQDERREFKIFKGAHHAIPDESPEELVDALMN